MILLAKFAILIYHSIAVVGFLLTKIGFYHGVQYSIAMGSFSIKYYKATMYLIAERPPKVVVTPPGYVYIFIARLVVSKKSYDEVIEPSILDMQEEHYYYLQREEQKMARWVKVRYFFTFLAVLGMSLPIIKQLADIIDRIDK